MKRDLVMTRPLTSSFLSCEKDTETILRKLFIESRPYSDVLKRLLVVQSKDCLDEDKYNEKIKEYSVARLVDEGYIFLKPVLYFKEHEKIKSYILLHFDDFSPDYNNPEFRDCEVRFDIICHADQWDLKDYQQRPLKIVGYIDGLLNKTKLSGIGTLQFKSCYQTTINETISGYTLVYEATHGSDDQIPANE